jgi:hypothetical protein
MRWALAMVVAVAASLVVFDAPAQEPKPGGGADIMKQKLKYSQAVLEGLAVENYSQIAANAKALNLLSQMAEWRILPSADYIRYSSDFQQLTNQLTKSANSKNLDAATLNYVQLTLNCVNCHKHVREHRAGDEANEAEKK